MARIWPGKPKTKEDGKKSKQAKGGKEKPKAKE